MPRAPNLAPARRAILARADVDILCDVYRAALRQIIGVEAGGNRRPQHVGLQAGEGRGQENVVGAARNQHLFVSNVSHALGGGDELGAHISEIALRTHREYGGFANAILSDFEIPEAPRYLTVAPISHVAGTKVLPALMRGGTVHMLKGFDPDAVFKTIERERINFTLFVPTMIYVLLDHPALDRTDLSSLELLLYGASARSLSRPVEGEWWVAARPDYFCGRNSGHIARHFSASGRKSSGPISWHSALAEGKIHGCALRMYICAAGTSHFVSSSVPARMLIDCGRPARSP